MVILRVLKFSLLLTTIAVRSDQKPAHESAYFTPGERQQALEEVLVVVQMWLVYGWKLEARSLAFREAVCIVVPALRDDALSSSPIRLRTGLCQFFFFLSIEMTV